MLRSLRDEVAAVASGCGVPDAGLHDIRLSVTEIVTNAIVHAYADRQRGGEIAVEVYHDEGKLRIVVADDGPGIAPRVGSPGLGLGLPVVASLTQSLELIPRAGGGAEVHMVFPCPGAASGA